MPRPRNRSWDDGWLTVYHGCEMRGEPATTLYGLPNQYDGHVLHAVFGTPMDLFDGRTFLQELEKRGYLLETIRFEIKRRWKPNERPGDLPEVPDPSPAWNW